MRQIKFRGWDGVGMIYCGQDQSWEHGWNLRWLFDHCDGDIMEFTGLLDKSGVEIYEGDIIEEGRGNGAVEWLERRAAFGYLTDTATIQLYGFYGEVIGNIYEHKELLE